MSNIVCVVLILCDFQEKSLYHIIHLDELIILSVLKWEIWKNVDFNIFFTTFASNQVLLSTKSLNLGN